MKNTLWLCLGIGCALAACTQGTNDAPGAQGESGQQGSDRGMANPHQGPLPNTVEIATLRFPADFKPDYKVVSSDRMDYANVPRLVLRATIPEGLSREALRMNIEHLLATAWQQQKIDGVTLGAISVFGYREGDDTSGSYTAAMGEFAPGGEWQKADPRIPLRQWTTKVEIPEGYFKKREASLLPGTKINLIGDDVILSDDPGKWDDAHKIIAVPSRTQGKLLESKTFPITADFTLYRCKVEIRLHGKTYRGWVHKHDIQPLP